MTFSSDFQDRVVLVTGGTQGVGRGIAQAFLEAGARVVVCGRNAPDSLPEAGGRRAEFIACDVREAEAVRALVAGVAERHGRLDVLVNNAGGAPPADAASASPRFHESIVRLNLLAPLHLAQAANAVMQAQAGGGVILFIGSVSAVRPSPGTAAYGAAKAGVLSLVASLAIEWAPRVRVVAVSPGLVRTEKSHLHYGDEQGLAAVGATVPAGRLAEPQDVAQACLYMASARAAYVNGTHLLVHGGGERPAFLAAAAAACTAPEPDARRQEKTETATKEIAMKEEIAVKKPPTLIKALLACGVALAIGSAVVISGVLGDVRLAWTGPAQAASQAHLALPMPGGSWMRIFQVAFGH